MAKSPRRQIVDFAIRALPDAIEDDARRILGLEVKRTASATPKALPAPPKPLALPAPGPRLPRLASKPRGGQFYPDAPLGPQDAQSAGYKLENFTDRNGVDRYLVITPDGRPASGYHASTPEGGWELANAHFKTHIPRANRSPEAAARDAREIYNLTPYARQSDEPQVKLGDWLERALAKYYKTDFGSPDDPLRGLAERGLHYDPQMTPDLWQRTVDENLMEDPIGFFTVPRHESEIKAQFEGKGGKLSFLGSYDPMGQGALMQAAPWLRKQPVTDMLYGIRGGLDLGHFTDEMQNALRAREVGLPMELAVRPESLDRMTFAQAAEHVGKINQFRAKEMERAALSALDSPAIQTFKEYAEDNPRGLRWVELKAPEPTEDLLGDFAVKEGRDVSPEDMETVLKVRAQRALEDALKYEGDTMGHCVGGYCPDVMSGRSRIFSLRDAKGEPHVTIETKPSPRLYSDVVRAVGDKQASEWLDEGLTLGQMVARAKIDRPQDIIQIKGKQNRAPKDDYLPFVQDFVKSQQWGNVGDLANTGLVRLPDGRYLTHDQMDEIIRNESLDDLYQSYDFNARGFPRDPAYMDPEDWTQFQRHFEGFAIGGRVDADRCFCHNPMSVKKGR